MARGTGGNAWHQLHPAACAWASPASAAPSAIMLPTLRQDPRVAVVAAADPRAEARRRFEADFGGAAYETVDALCADPQVEVVYVASPHQFHAEHAQLAAAHGKHLLVEKPIALTLGRRANAIVDAARKAGVHLIVGHSHSFDAPILRARELIASGKLWRGAHDHRAQLHRFPVSAAPPRRARHRARWRRAVQPGAAPGRRGAAARRRPGRAACAR